jgi:hypothetical protein
MNTPTTPQAAQVLSDDEIIELAIHHGLGRALKPIGFGTADVFYTDNSYRTAALLDFAEAHQAAILSKLQAAPQAAQGVGEVTDAMALAFHGALTDGSIGQAEVDEIKVGLRAALDAHPAPSPAVAVPLTGQQMYEAYRLGAASQNREPCMWDELTSSAHRAWNTAAVALATQQEGKAK